MTGTHEEPPHAPYAPYAFSLVEAKAQPTLTSKIKISKRFRKNLEVNNGRDGIRAAQHKRSKVA